MRQLRFMACIVLLFFGCQQKTMVSGGIIPKNFDWQGHRGARGLMPENTIPAFLKALEYPVKTLELDVAITKDSQVLISHDPLLSHSICSNPDGSPVTEAQEKSLSVFQLTYAQIQQYDCGSRGNPNFPNQQALKVSKPLLRDMIDAVEAYCKKNHRTLPIYNIEIKSRPAWDGVYTPLIETYVRLVIAEIKNAHIQKRVCVQSFDVRALQAVRKIAPDIRLALLIENKDGFVKNMDQLGFTPSAYSPYYGLVDPALVTAVHDRKMRLIPWTVNDTTTMQKLIQLGVDGIITDYPNFISQVEK